jgi:hypothetical protein
MKVLRVRDLYFEPVAISRYVAWGWASASAPVVPVGHESEVVCVAR